MRSIPMRTLKQSAGQESTYRIRSPLLFGILQAIDPDTRISVLDLNQANSSLVDYFSHFRCKLLLPGSQHALQALEIEEEDDENSLRFKTEQCLVLPQDAGFVDLVLLWDLPNYLDKRLLQSVMAALTQYTDRNTILHTYVHTHQTMPGTPANFHFTAEHQIQVDMTAAWTVTSPAYHQALLNKVLFPFQVDRGMLLANGLQEYILRYK